MRKNKQKITRSNPRAAGRPTIDPAGKLIQIVVLVRPHQARYLADYEPEPGGSGFGSSTRHFIDDGIAAIKKLEAEKP